MARIFVSYRRQDSPYVAAAVKDHIERRFGADSVFFDIDNIPVGADFRKHIAAAVSECGALLVLIGDKWLMPEERTGKNRLFDPRDYVRMEIEAALARGIPVVPVLVEAAEMPAAGDLPESIGDLIFRNAAEVRAGRDFQNHMTRLVDGLWSLLGHASTTASKSSAPVPEETPPAQPATTALTVVPKDKPQAQNAKNSTPSVERSAPRRTGERSSEYRLDAGTVRRIFVGSQTYVGSAIPPQKLQGAASSYVTVPFDVKTVLALYDDTLWGGAKDGFLLTPHQILWHNLGDVAHTLSWRNIKSVGFKKDGVGVAVNDLPISVSDPVSAQALVTLLNEIMKSRS